MAKIIQPYNNFIIVRPEPRRTKTDGGIDIPDSADDVNKLIWATIIRKSRKVEDLEVGDRIYIPFDIGYEEMIGGIKHRFLNASDPMAIWGIEVEEEIYQP